MEDKHDEGNEDRNAAHAKMTMLISDHEKDADKDEVEDPKLTQEKIRGLSEPLIARPLGIQIFLEFCMKVLTNLL